MWWILHCHFIEYIFAILAELPQVQVQVSLTGCCSLAHSARRIFIAKDCGAERETKLPDFLPAYLNTCESA